MSLRSGTWKTFEAFRLTAATTERRGSVVCAAAGNLDPGRGATDLAAVNPKILRPILALFVAGSALITCAAKSSVAPTVVSVGDNTFSVTRQASTAFDRDTERLQTEARDDAAKYCAAQGKQLQIVSLKADKPLFALGYASARIVFRAVEPGTPDAPVANASGASATVGEKPTATGELYNDLLKLEDLRQRGILTDKEFQSAKKRILDRAP